MSWQRLAWRTRPNIEQQLLRGIQVKTMKIETKEQLFELIEKTRVDRKLTFRAAVSRTEGIDYAQWHRFSTSKRKPSYDHLFAMAKGVGLRISVSAR